MNLFHKKHEDGTAYSKEEMQAYRAEKSRSGPTGKNGLGKRRRGEKTAQRELLFGFSPGEKRKEGRTCSP